MKKALVTGVSWDTGIGYAISKQLINDGFFVYAVFHSDDSTAKTTLENEFPARIEFIQCNLTDRIQIKDLIDRFSDINLDAIDLRR